MSGPPSPVEPLIVRLPNWVGDVVMALPALARLQAAGYRPRLVGKRWAGPLLAGQFDPPAVLPSGTAARVRLLRRLRAAPPPITGRRGRIDTLLLTNSFSSALEARLAGLHPLGYRQDGRGWLLARAIPPPAGIHPAGIHESERFDRLAQALIAANGPRLDGAGTGPEPEAAQAPRLRPTAEALASADALLAARLGKSGRPGGGQTGQTGSGQADSGQADREQADSGQTGGVPLFACLVPFATGTLEGAAKAWPQFPAFAAELKTRLPVVIVPGPAEVEQARQQFPGCISLEDVDMGVYSAILARAAVVVANDTGPAHVAAAVGAPVVSVLGPSDAARYRPLGPRVTVVQASPWPSIDAVRAAVDQSEPEKQSDASERRVRAAPI